MKDDPLNRTKVKRGSHLPNAKLNESDVSAILELMAIREYHKLEAKKLKNSVLAEKFDVHVRTIDRISCGESWTHVT